MLYYLLKHFYICQNKTHLYELRIQVVKQI